MKHIWKGHRWEKRLACWRDLARRLYPLLELSPLAACSAVLTHWRNWWLIPAKHWCIMIPVRLSKKSCDWSRMRILSWPIRLVHLIVILKRLFVVSLDDYNCKMWSYRRYYEDNKLLLVVQLLTLRRSPVSKWLDDFQLMPSAKTGLRAKVRSSWHASQVGASSRRNADCFMHRYVEHSASCLARR